MSLVRRNVDQPAPQLWMFESECPAQTPNRCLNGRIQFGLRPGRLACRGSVARAWAVADYHLGERLHQKQSATAAELFRTVQIRKSAGFVQDGVQRPPVQYTAPRCFILEKFSVIFGFVEVDGQAARIGCVEAIACLHQNTLTPAPLQFSCDQPQTILRYLRKPATGPRR